MTFVPGYTNIGLFAISNQNAVYNIAWDSNLNTITRGGVFFSTMNNVASASYNQDATLIAIVGNGYVYLASTGKPPYCQTVDATGSCTICVGTLNSLQSRIPPSCNCPAGFYSNSRYSQDCLPCPFNGCLSCLGRL